MLVTIQRGAADIPQALAGSVDGSLQYVCIEPCTATAVAQENRKKMKKKNASEQLL